MHLQKHFTVVEGSPREFAGLTAELKCGPPGFFFLKKEKNGARDS